MNVPTHGTCRSCGVTYQLCKDLTVRTHSGGHGLPDCPGSRRPPVEPTPHIHHCSVCDARWDEDAA